jgi:hypothetical protein
MRHFTEIAKSSLFFSIFKYLQLEMNTDPEKEKKGKQRMNHREIAFPQTSKGTVRAGTF